MAYLLSIISPGLGQLASKRWLSGLLLLTLWAMGEVSVFVAMSFEVRAIFGLPIWWALLSALAMGHLFWLRRKKKLQRPKLRWSLLVAPLGPLIGVFSFLLITSSLVRPMAIRSGSMTPSAVTGDVILVQLFAPFVFGIHIGDIVLVTHPQHPERLLIKRIIGIAGDQIRIRGGVMYRNGRQLSQCELRRLRDHETNDQVIERLEVLEGRPYLVWDQPAVRSSALTARVPPGHFFVLGDNRDRSGDSRGFGTLPVTSVSGVVTTRIWPVLTNAVYRAPIKARQAAFTRCSKRGGSRGSRP